MPRGCTRAEVEAAPPVWEITNAVIADSDSDTLARALQFDELLYRLGEGDARAGESQALGTHRLGRQARFLLVAQVVPL